MIERDRLKAFLDDLALISAKHGLAVSDSTFCSIQRARGSAFTGYIFNNYDRLLACFGGNSSSEAAYKVTAASLDVSTITGHQRIALERSLAETRRLVEDR